MNDTNHHADDDHDDFGGLDRDLPVLLSRRSALSWIGGLSLGGLAVACSGSDGTPGAGSPATAATTTGSIDGADVTQSTSATASSEVAAETSSTMTGSASGDLAGAEIADETAGPFPADGSNGPNLLDVAGVVRADITSSIGELSGTAEGVPMTVQLTVVDADTGTPASGAAVYLWHCTADGRYSMYEIEDQNFLRGVQIADDDGRLSFTSVFPGCYAGRWPHCHFEVYDGADTAVSGSQAIKTSQLALARSDCEAVYADGRYAGSADNLSRLSLETDGVFRDGWADQLATATGSVADGYTVSLLVRV